MYEIVVTFGCVQNWSTLPHFTFRAALRKPQSCCSVSTITDFSHHSREICSATCPSVTKVQVQALARAIISPSRRQTGVGIICLQPLFLSCVGVIQGLWRGTDRVSSSVASFSVRPAHYSPTSLVSACLSLISSVFNLCSKVPGFSSIYLFLFYLFTLCLLFCLKKENAHDI